MFWPTAFLAAIVAAILFASHKPAYRPLFQWVPVPLWCYLLPMVAVSLRLLPPANAAYQKISGLLLPFALVFLLLEMDMRAFLKSGKQSLLAALVGAVGVILGASIGSWVLRSFLPEDYWKAVAGLSATWTGGTMNLLAVRSLVAIPDPLFAPLVVTDAVIAYSWMALLMAAAGAQGRLSRLFHLPDASAKPIIIAAKQAESSTAKPLLIMIASALAIVAAARWIAPRLPTSSFVSSASGWTVLLVTTLALALSLVTAVRQQAAGANRLGYPILYVVLAATGAQADLKAFGAAPQWMALGAITVGVHGGLLLFCGRVFRIPLGILATASQANIGGVVSAPMVGAVYHESLVPVGLLLAMAGNALGTYCGLLAAGLARLLG